MKKARFVALAAVVITVAVAGLAFAFWTQGGTGSGNATAGTTSAITVNQTGTPTGLYPGGTPVALSGTFTNPNAHSVHISGVTATVHPFSSSLVDGLKPACTQADFAIGGSSGANVVPAGTGGSWSGLTLQLVDGAGNQDNCKGVSITLDYTAAP